MRSSVCTLSSRSPEGMKTLKNKGRFDAHLKVGLHSLPSPTQ